MLPRRRNVGVFTRGRTAVRVVWRQKRLVSTEPVLHLTQAREANLNRSGDERPANPECNNKCENCGRSCALPLKKFKISGRPGRRRPSGEGFGRDSRPNPSFRELSYDATYARNQWEALRRYTEDGRLTIENNVSERTLRHQAIGRKNWLFLGSESAGPRAAVLYTILAGAKRHRIEPVELIAVPAPNSRLFRPSHYGPTDRSDAYTNGAIYGLSRASRLSDTIARSSALLVGHTGSRRPTGNPADSIIEPVPSSARAGPGGRCSPATAGSSGRPRP